MAECAHICFRVLRIGSALVQAKDDDVIADTERIVRLQDSPFHGGILYEGHLPYRQVVQHRSLVLQPRSRVVRRENAVNGVEA